MEAWGYVVCKNDRWNKTIADYYITWFHYLILIHGLFARSFYISRTFQQCNKLNCTRDAQKSNQNQLDIPTSIKDFCNLTRQGEPPPLILPLSNLNSVRISHLATYRPLAEFKWPLWMQLQKFLLGGFGVGAILAVYWKIRSFSRNMYRLNETWN